MVVLPRVEYQSQVNRRQYSHGEAPLHGGARAKYSKESDHIEGRVT